MCGIAGSINAAFTNSTLDLIKHRGPDHQSLIEETVGRHKIIFGHARLSILELSDAGNQPMYTADGRCCIIFNGEVYNHLELRKKLPLVRFKGHSDTETILYYIQEFGVESIVDFNGIFAFAYLDKQQERIWLARDHFGVKPLYYFADNKRLVFGSELKVILDSPAYEKEIDLDALNTLLTFRYTPSPKTIFKGIYRLRPGHFIEYDFQCLNEKRYWNQAQKIDHAISQPDAIAEYQRLLQQSVKRQLLSDVPVGLLLSGGLDSAVLGHLMAENCRTRVKTFTVGFEGTGDFNETGYARQTAELIGADHHEIIINKGDYLRSFHRSFYHVEEPIAESTIPALDNVAQLAHQHVKVVMSGQGIDEPMSGYKRYYGEYLFSKYKKILPIVPVNALARIFPRNHTLARGRHALQFKNDLDRFIGIYTIFTDDLKQEVYNKSLHAMKDVSQHHLFQSAFSVADQSNGSLSKLLYLDTRTMLPDDLLLFNDKITMAHSLENRVPYLDLELVNFIERLPVKFKRSGRTGKYLHREAVKEWIPRDIINRKKRGFATPVDQWFQSELSNTLSELVHDVNSFSRQFFNLPAIDAMLLQHKQRKRNYKHQLFMLLSLELWFNQFYKQF